MRSHRQGIIGTILLATIIVSGILVVNYFVDPLQFFRRASYSPALSKEQRFQNPGIARNYNYDTIILGTSVTENFSTPQINQKWNCTSVKLAFSGGTLREEAFMADVALRTGKVKKVLWGVDFTAARGNSDRVRIDSGPFPFYLYDENKINDIMYLLNTNTTKQSIKALRNIVDKPSSQTVSLDMLNNWQKEWVFGKESVIKDYERTISIGRVEEGLNAECFRENLTTNLINVIRENPTVEFILFYPPYSMPFYKTFESTNTIEDWIRTKFWLFNELRSFQNVKIYDFQNDYLISTNLDNYKDMMHYSEGINGYMIERISKQEYLIQDPVKYENDLQNFHEKLQGYDPYQI